MWDKQGEDNCETVGQKKSNLEGLGPEKVETSVYFESGTHLLVAFFWQI